MARQWIAIHGFVALLGWMLISSTCAGQEPKAPTKAELIRIGKSSTALLEVGNGGFASAFCVHPDGMFVTNDHALQSNPTLVKLILNSGEPGQVIVDAKPVRRDKELDLALLKVEKPAKYPFLKLGTETDLIELLDVVAFGFPFGLGVNPRQKEYPAVSVNMGAINSLPRRDGRIYRIQLSVAVNPGNSGGPLVDLKGEVVGVIVGRIEGMVGAGIDLAIPVGHLEKFLARPEITFNPSAISEGDLIRPADFRASVASLITTTEPLKLELVLDANTPRERRVEMSRSGNEYVAQIAPAIPRRGPSFVGVKILFEDGQLAGKAEDRTIRVTDRELKLSDLKVLRLKPEPSVELTDGTSVTGPISGLKDVPISVGGRTDSWNLGLARSIKIDQIDPEGVVNCLVIASNAKGEVGRVNQLIFKKGAVRPSFDAIRDGRFIRPFRSSLPITYLKMESSPGDYIGQGKNYEFAGDQLKIQRDNRGVSIQVGSFGDYRIVFGAPLGQFLQVGEYPGAKRHPFSDKSPGIEVNGNGRGCNMIDGKFVVWELELKGNEVVRLAIDFVQRCEGKSPPLTGMLRYNSNYY